VNVLKVAENLFDARLAIAKEASKILSQQSARNRHYYKMIKDNGGFQKLDLSGGVPKMKFIDLDAQALSDAKERAEATALELINKKAAMELEKVLKEKETSEDSEHNDNNESLPDNESDFDNFDGSGPMMM
jgi:predicted nucleotidyltransferase